MDVELVVSTVADHVAHMAGAAVVAVVAVAVVHAGEESQKAVHEASEVMGHRCNAVVNPTAGNAVTLYQRTCRPSSRLME